MKKTFFLFSLLVSLGLFSACSKGSDNSTIVDSISPSPQSSIVESQTPSLSPSGVACTMEVKICPDGTSVGRMPPNCEFTECPEETPFVSGNPSETPGINIRDPQAPPINTSGVDPLESFIQSGTSKVEEDLQDPLENL